jgi:hypothetical protein
MSPHGRYGYMSNCLNRRLPRPKRFTLIELLELEDVLGEITGESTATENAGTYPAAE